ncbi:LPS translocon maturation chaperone LptM [Oceanospirillum sp.]
MCRLKAIVSLCLITLALAGCGQKGPLYLPETSSESATNGAQAQ